MLEKKSIAVVVPAFNEERLIARTVTTLPDFIDHIIVVDDQSHDRTSDIVRALRDRDARVALIRHEVNRGVGAAIATGYIWCRDHDVDVAVVMAGDAQMDPADLPELLAPVVSDRADYAKGNRLVTGEAWRIIPKSRYLGNSALTLLTKIASGYWHVTDSQTGYTAIHKRVLQLIPLQDIYPRYGMPNDLLVTLNIYNFRVVDVPVNPVYNIGEDSGIRPARMVLPLSLLLVRLFFKRMVQKYIIRDFHPLVFFYVFGFGLLLLDIPLIIRFFCRWSLQDSVPQVTALCIVFFTLLGFQSLLFAMLFDMEANRELKGR